MRDARSSVAAFALLALLSSPGESKAQAVGFAPTVAPLNDGVTLSATPVVSADRRYVRLSMQPTFQAINGFTNFPVPGAVGGGGGGANRGGGQGGFGNVPPGDLSLLEDNDVIRRPILTAQSAKARAVRGKKSQPDPVIVPIKKKETGKATGAPRG